MTQQAWTPADAHSAEHTRAEQQRQDYSRRGAPAGQTSSLGGWINTVMPERAPEMNGYPSGPGYGQPMGYTPAPHAAQNGAPHNSVQQLPFNNTAAFSAPAAQGPDVHALYQRIEDLSQTIARMERSQPQAPTFAGMNSYAGQNRRGELPIPYAGPMRRYEEASSQYRGAASGHNLDLVNQLSMRVEEAERQAREAWRAAQNALQAKPAAAKAESANSESSIARAERILAAADETARKTLALLNAKQAQPAAAPITDTHPTSPTHEAQMHANAIATQQIEDIKDQLNEVLKNTSASQSLSEIQNQLNEVLKNTSASPSMSEIQNQLNEVLKNTTASQSLSEIQTQLNEVLKNTAASPSLSEIQNQLNEVLKITATPPQYSDLKEHLSTLIKSFETGPKDEDTALAIKSQMADMLKNFEIARNEDTLMLDKLFQQLQTTHKEDSLAREKILHELSSVRKQEAITCNEIEDISSRLEAQLDTLTMQLKFDQPVMEALQDIYMKIENVTDSIALNKDQNNDNEDIFALVQQQLNQLHLGSAQDDAALVEHLGAVHQKIDAVSNKLDALQLPNDTSLLQQLDAQLQALNIKMSEGPQEVIGDLNAVKGMVQGLDQRFFLLSDAIENVVNTLKTQRQPSQDNGQLNEIISRIDTLQEQLVDAPARMGLATMEYQLHQLDNKLDDMKLQGADDGHVKTIQAEMQNLKAALEKTSDNSGIHKLERDISEIQFLLQSQAPQHNTRAFGELMSSISRVEMGLTNVLNNSGTGSLIAAFDGLHEAFQMQRSLQERSSQALSDTLTSALKDHAVSQDKYSKSLLSQMNQTLEAQAQKQAQEFKALSTQNQVSALGENIKQLHEEIRAEIAALAQKPTPQISDELAAMPKELDKLSYSFHSRFQSLEEHMSDELPAIMSNLIKGQLNQASAPDYSEDLAAVRHELSNLRTTLQHVLVLQNEAASQNAQNAPASVQFEHPHSEVTLSVAPEAFHEASIHVAAPANSYEIEAAFENTYDTASETAPAIDTTHYKNIAFMDELPAAAQVVAHKPTSAIDDALEPLMAHAASDQDLLEPNAAQDDTFMPQAAALAPLEDVMMRPAPVTHSSENKQDFIAAARKAAQAAALEASSGNLASRVRSQLQDPFAQNTPEAAGDESNFMNTSKKLLSKLGIGAPQKAEKQTPATAPKFDKSSYVAPAAEDDLLEPNDDKSSSIKKTMMLSASAAVLAAGAFSYFTAQNSTGPEIAGGDTWLKSGDVTSSLPDAPNTAQNKKSLNTPAKIPEAQTPVLDGTPAFESPATWPHSQLETAPTHAQNNVIEYKPYETIGGVPVPPSMPGAKTAALSADTLLQSTQAKTQALAAMRFPMPTEGIGSQKLRAAAAQGNASAVLEIANRYADGKGVARDMVQAIEWFNRAADLNSAPAQYRLGSFYEKGYGVTKSLTKAAGLYEKAALAGNRKAMHNLAVLHAEGFQGKPNFEMSLRWFREAAERGLADSQYNLGVVYARGLGVKQDLVEAYKWFAIAAEAGDMEAVRKRDEVAAKMDPKMVHWAKSAVRLFQPRDNDPMANDGQMPFETWDELPMGKVSAIAQLKKAA